MQKIWTIAVREYKAMVATKAFLISLILMPLIMLGSILAQTYFARQSSTVDKTIVLVDGTGGVLTGDLEKAVEARNRTIASGDAPVQGLGPNPLGSLSRIILKRHTDDTLTDEARLELSDQIRRHEIDAFVEIPEGALELPASAAASPAGRYFAANAPLQQERQWLERVMNEQLTARRLEALELNPALVKRATASVRLAPTGLYSLSATGEPQAADATRNAIGILLPFGFMMFMFMILMLSSQPLLEGVLEEKTGRIAEVLLGSASSFQLMCGKLLGNVAGSLSIVAIYGAGAAAFAWYYGWVEMIPMDLLQWFIVYQVLAVLFFGSIFMAVGAAVSQLKEAQSLLLPVWLTLVLPMFMIMQMIREPNGGLATGLSFFPPATPLAMVVRLASEESIPAWQPVAGMFVMAIATLICVYLAGRVFRIGILWQGKTPQIGQLLRWALRG